MLDRGLTFYQLVTLNAAPKLSLNLVIDLLSARPQILLSRLSVRYCRLLKICEIVIVPIPRCKKRRSCLLPTELTSP